MLNAGPLQIKTSVALRSRPAVFFGPDWCSCPTAADILVTKSNVHLLGGKIGGNGHKGCFHFLSEQLEGLQRFSDRERVLTNAVRSVLTVQSQDNCFHVLEWV